MSRRIPVKVFVEDLGNNTYAVIVTGYGSRFLPRNSERRQTALDKYAQKIGIPPKNVLYDGTTLRLQGLSCESIPAICSKQRGCIDHLDFRQLRGNGPRYRMWELSRKIETHGATVIGEYTKNHNTH